MCASTVSEQQSIGKKGCSSLLTSLMQEVYYNRHSKPGLQPHVEKVGIKLLRQKIQQEIISSK